MASRLSSDRRQLPVPLPSDPRQAREVVRAEQRRRHEQLRRRRHVVIGVMLAAFVIAAAGLGRQLFFAGSDEAPVTVAATRGPAPMLDPPSLPASQPPEAGPSSAAGTFAYAGSAGPVAGGAGAVKKYRVAVENGSGQQVDAFATAVEQVFADPGAGPRPGSCACNGSPGRAPRTSRSSLPRRSRRSRSARRPACTPPATARAGSPARSSSTWRAG
ncbi:hypothetical protein GCM10027610_112720 [Dactylosporangium cerinum]